MRPIDADELYARLMKRYLMHNMKDDRLDMAARAAIGSCMEAVNRSKTITITEPPNDPLTMEELREMDGEPVWCCNPHYTKDGHWAIIRNDKYDVPEYNHCAYAVGICWPISEYGKTWLAYRRKPEEGTT